MGRAHSFRPLVTGGMPLVFRYAEVAELVDALASGASGGNPVEVQVLSSVPCLRANKSATHRRIIMTFFGVDTAGFEPQRSF